MKSEPIGRISRESILAHASSLPAAMGILGELRRLLQDPNAEFDEIVKLMRRDSALAARVLRICNSVAYCGPGTIASVDDAVRRIGFDEIVGVAGAATATAMGDEDLIAYGICGAQFRDAMLLHAVAAETIARLSGIDPASAYSIGLLRGIGMMVLDRTARNSIPPFAYFNSAQHPSYASWERARLGVLASEVAETVLDEWHFPLEVITAIQHQSLLDAVAWNDRYACLLNVAGAIVMTHGLVLPGELLSWKSTPALLDRLNLSEDGFERARTEAVERFEQIRMAL